MGSKILNENGFIEIENYQEYINFEEEDFEMGCICSDRISKEGFRVGYMLRDEPSEVFADSGWRFFRGDEDETYNENADNFHIFSLNSIANYDKTILKYLSLPVGSALIRIYDDKFIEDDSESEIEIKEF